MPESWKAVQTQAAGTTLYLSKCIETVNKRATKLGRRLDDCVRLPDIFRANGLVSVHHDIISSDNDASTRRDFTSQLPRALTPLFVRFAEMEDSGMAIQEAVALGEGMLEEARDGKAYLRWDATIVVGRKPET
jgi:hypothetical protein